MGNVATLEVADVGDVPIPRDQVEVGRIDDGRHLGRRPDEEASFLALAVRVGGGEEPTVRMGHLAQHVVAGLLDHGSEKWLASHLPRFQIEPRQLRVIVEHLLEVRDEPARVHGVAMEATADLVVHPPLSHAATGEDDRLEELGPSRRAVLAQHQLENLGVGKLRRAAESAPVGVDVREQRLGGATGQRRIERRARQRRLVRRRHAGDELRRRLLDLVAPLAIRLRDGRQHPREPGDAVAVFGWEICAAVERLAVRRQKNR
jgi:hypothetical protein